MKENWQHIKFGDAFNLQMGKTPSRDNPTYWDNGQYSWVSIADMKDNSISTTKEKISQCAIDETHIHKVKKGTVIMSFKLTIGKTAIAPYDLYTNEAIMAFEPKEEIEVLPEFLMFYLRAYHWGGNRAVLGVTINKSVISGSFADIPPIDIQRKVVNELERLTAIIADKRQQLKELDNLAQTIFYDMFGDPVKNERKWKIKKILEVGKVKIGPFGSLLHTSDYIQGGVHLVNPTQMEGGFIIKDDTFTVSEQKAKELEVYKMQTNDFVFARRGEIGRCAIVTEKENGFLCGTGSLFVRFAKDINSTYALHWTKCPSFVKELVSKAKGATMLNINCSIVENLCIPIPPLCLQQSFAEKIQLIENQKTDLAKSIQEFENLLAQRMEHYFA